MKSNKLLALLLSSCLLTGVSACGSSRITTTNINNARNCATSHAGESLFGRLFGIESTSTNCQSVGSKAVTVEPFSLATFDGKARINGQIDLPDTGNSRVPLVVLIPGSGLADRDYFTPVHRDHAASHAFLDLSRALTAQGIAVARYDVRGVKQRALDCPGFDGTEASIGQYWKTCIDGELRKSVVPQNTVDDALLVYQHAMKHPAIAPQQIAIIAHSEGSLTTGKLLGTRAINPAGIVILGGLLRSPAETTRWSGAEKTISLIQSLAPGALTITREQIQAALPRLSLLLGEHAALQLASQHEAWGRAEFEALKKSREAAISREMATSPTDTSRTLYFNQGQARVPYASVAYVGVMAADNTPVISRYQEFSGPVFAHFGDEDWNIGTQFQLDGWKAKMPKKNVHIRVHRGKGHMLGGHPTAGPIDPTVQQNIIDDVRRIFAAEQSSLSATPHSAK